MCIHSIKGLQRLLRKRIPEIQRWQRVTVYKWNDVKLPWFISPVKDMFYILWHNPRGKNIHTDEYKEVPMGDIDMVFERNRQRYYNKTKAYR